MVRVVMLFLMLCMSNVLTEAQNTYDNNEATVFFDVHTDKMTQFNYIVDSNTKHLNYMIL